MDNLQKKYIEFIITYPNIDLENDIKNNKDYKQLSDIIKKDLLINMDKNDHLNEIRSAIAMKKDIRNKSNKEIYNIVSEYINNLDICNPIILYIFDNWNKKGTWNKSPLVYEFIY